MNDENIKKYEQFFIESNKRLDEIKEKEYDGLDKNSKSEYDGLKEMFQMLLEIDLKKIDYIQLYVKDKIK